MKRERNFILKDSVYTLYTRTFMQDDAACRLEKVMMYLSPLHIHADERPERRHGYTRVLLLSAVRDLSDEGSLSTYKYCSWNCANSA
jgi:hypothetical protein